MLEVLHACCYRTVVLIRKEAVRNRERGGKPSLQTSCSWPVLEAGGWTFLNALRSHRVMQNVKTHQPTVEAFQTAWPSVLPVHSFTQPALTNTVLASLAGNSKIIDEHLDSLRHPNPTQHLDLPLYPSVHHQAKWPSHHLDQLPSLNAQQVDAGPALNAHMFPTAGPHLAWATLQRV